MCRETQAERSPRQTLEPTNRNRIRHSTADESAIQDEVQYCPEQEV